MSGSWHESDEQAAPLALDGEDVRVYFQVDTVELEGRVLAMSWEGLEVALDVERMPRSLQPGAVLQDVFFAGGQVHDLRLRVSRIAPGDRAGELVLYLAPADDRTSADLWLEAEGLRRQEGGITRQVALEPPADLPKLPGRGLYTDQARLERLGFLRGATGAALDAMTETALHPERLTGNIENMVGGVEVPVGIAGPLWFRGENVQGMIYAPFATTEGALVASATRGATALTRAGGVRTRVLSQRMLRVPLFMLTNMEGAVLFARWISDHSARIAEQAVKVSRHAKLVSLEPRVFGRMVHLAFVYETGDAAGQNMTTACTWHACQWLMRQMRHYEPIRFENFIIEANMSGDKKVNYNSFISGRGTRVVAEAFLETRVLRSVLKVTPEVLLQAHRGIEAGSIQVGMVGHNINVANTIGAMFTATGQDIACVHESSVAHLHLEPVDDGVHASLLLPALIVGTVGGGTHLARQRELLELMDCAGADKAPRLAEIIAGFALGLDLSTLSAVASGQFATAHERLGRNRPVQWFTREDLGPVFFERGLREALGDPALTVEAAQPVPTRSTGSSIVTELTARKVNKLVGHFPFRLDYRSGGGGRASVEVMAKVKPLDDEVILMVNSLATMCGGKLQSVYARFRDRTGFRGCHVRELEVYRQAWSDPRFRDHVPAIYGLHAEPAREAFVVVMEHMADMVLMDTADDTRGWQREHIEAALRGAAQLHAVWLGREDELRAQPWLGPVQSTRGMIEMMPLWEALEVHGAEEFPDIVDPRGLQFYLRRIRTLGDWWPELEAMPRTLIHNDFNPRNICLRRDGDGYRLCAYDWELATLHVPQHDLAELLSFVLQPDADEGEVRHYVELHRQELEAASGVALPRAQWELGFRLSLYDLVVNRFALYMMAHTFRHYGFVERVAATLNRLVPMNIGGARGGSGP